MVNGLNSNPWASAKIDTQTVLRGSIETKSLGDFAHHKIAEYTGRSYKRKGVTKWNQRLRATQTRLGLDDSQMRSVICDVFTKDPLRVTPAGYSSLSRLIQAIYAIQYRLDTEPTRTSTQDDEYRRAYL